jgi:hypothetical protein
MLTRMLQRRTRRSVSTLGGAAPDTIIGRAAADRAGARPYRAHVAKTRRNVPRRIARERVPIMGIDLIPYVDARGRPPDRSDELINLHRPQILKDLWAIQAVHFSSIHGFRRRKFNVRLRAYGS